MKKLTVLILLFVAAAAWGEKRNPDDLKLEASNINYIAIYASNETLVGKVTEDCRIVQGKGYDKIPMPYIDAVLHKYQGICRELKEIEKSMRGKQK